MGMRRVRVFEVFFCCQSACKWAGSSGSLLGEELRRRLLLNLLPRPLLILWVQLDLALVHCPSINRGNLEGETNKQTNKQVEAAHAEVQMQGAVQCCVACGVQCTIHQSMWRSFRDALEMHWKSAEFDMQGHTLTCCSRHRGDPYPV